MLRCSHKRHIRHKKHKKEFGLYVQKIGLALRLTLAKLFFVPFVHFVRFVAADEMS